MCEEMVEIRIIDSSCVDFLREYAVADLCALSAE